MIEVDEAIERLWGAVVPGGVETVDVRQAAGRFVAREVRGTVSIPRFDQSSMDGYALGTEAAVSAGARFRVVGEVRAGEPGSVVVGAGEAARIFTGGRIPQGATAVVMQEEVVGCEDGEIEVTAAVEIGEWIRRAGADLCAGQILLRQGERIGEAAVGLLASQGLARVEVGAVPWVAVVSSGDELRPPGEALAEGQIYNSNGPMLAALLRGRGVAQVTEWTAGDTLERTRAVLDEALSEADVLIVSGGVSVGDYDHVRPALEAEGFEIDFWRVNLKPGKPFVFGTRVRDGKVALGLPGNPVSVFVTFHLFAVPVLRRWAGAAEPGGRTLSMPLVGQAENLGNRPHYLRGEVTAEGFRVQGRQESHALRSLAAADGLLRVEVGSRVEDGEAVQVLLF